MRVLLSLILGVSLLPAIARAQNDDNGPTLAEQAARARNARTSDLDARVAGRVVDGVYHNDLLGFELHPPPQWTPQSRGEMNVNEALGREALGEKAGVDVRTSGRVFGMHDGWGQNVVVSMKAILPGMSTSNISSEMQQGLRSAIPGIQFTREPTLLGNGAHRFDGFRATYSIRGHDLVQSFQYTLWHGYGVLLVITSTTPEKMTALLRQLQPRLVWTGAPEMAPVSVSPPASPATPPASTPTPPPK